MATNMKLFVELMARSTGLKRELRDSERGFQRFGSVARQEMGRIRQASGTLQGQLAALGLSIGVLQQFRISAQLDKDLTQIGQTAGASAKQISTMRSDFFRMGKDSGEAIENLKSGFDSLVQSGLNMREATSTLDGVNIAMAVTGVKAETLASALTVAGTHFDFDLAKPGQALAMLDKMTVAGRLGNAELATLAPTFSRVGVSAKAAGMSYDKTLAFIEALSLAEKNPERLGTLVTSSLRMFGDGRYMQKAQQGLGMRNLFFDKKGARRDVFEVFGDIQNKYKALKTDQQRAMFIHKGFGEMDTETKTGIQLMLNGPNLMKARAFAATIGDAGGTLKRDFNEATMNLITQGGRLKNTMRDAADGFIKPINETMAAWIQFMLDKKENGGLELSGKQIAGGTAAILGGTYLAARAGNKFLGGWANKKIGSLSGSTAIGVAEGKLLQAAAGVTPVFVTNWPGSGLPVPGSINTGSGGIAGGAANTAAGAAGSGAAARLKAWWALAGGTTAKGASYLPMLIPRLGFAGLALGGGYLTGTAINKVMGAGAGMMSGGRYKGDGYLGEMLYDALHGNGNSARPGGSKNEIKIDVHFDEMGRAFTKVNNMNTSIKTGGNRGDFFNALMSTEAM